MFRPKQFRHLHSVITTSWDHVEGMINLSGMMVNSPEPFVMKAVTKTLNDKTPLAVTYSSTSETYLNLLFGVWLVVLKLKLTLVFVW